MTVPHLTIDQSQIERFVGSLFRYADDGTYASLRAFDQKRRDVPPLLIEGVKINGLGLAELTRRAGIAAQKAADAESPAVFAPPIATFTDDFRARRTDLANGLTLSVEIDDTDPEQARTTLESILGPATIVVQSGSDWTDEISGEIKPNIHLHWRLSEPTRTDEEHDRLHDARRIAMRLVGADPTGTPAVHPLRWPGSWNVKRAPRLATITSENPDAEIHLIDALERLQEAEEKAGFASIGTPASAEPEIDKRRLPLLISAIQAIPNPGVVVHYDDWIRTGYALWRACGGSDQGRWLWEEWSKKSDKFNGTEQDAAWLRIAAACSGRNPPRTAGAGTIFHRAALAGWRMPEREEPPPATSEHEGSEPVAEPDINPGKPSLPLLWFEDIDAVLDARDFVQGILLEQTAAVVYGESNAGKTFFATDLALHVAAGFPWNQRRVEQGAVVYCALEGGIGFRNRVFAWKAAHGLDDKQIPFAAIPATVNLLHPDADTPKLIQSVNFAAEHLGKPVKLVVVDTLSRAMAGGDENSPEDMGALVVNMDKIRAETGAMVLFIHHSGKDAARGARGHSLLRAAVDTEIEVVADPEGDKKSATVVKQRDLSKGSVFTFSLQVVEIGRNRHGEAVTSCTVTPLSVTEAALRHAPNRRSMADSVVHARQLLVNALAKHGAMLPPGPDYPENTSACATDRFREEFYAEMDGETPAAKRQAFFRAKKSLTDREIAVARGPYIWLARP